MAEATTAFLCRGHVSNRTRDLYRREIEAFLADLAPWTEGRLWHLSADDLSRHLERMRDSGRGAATRRLRRSTLRGWFQALTAAGLVERNAALGIATERVPGRRPEPLPADERSALLLAPPATCDGKSHLIGLRDRALMLTGFMLGLRVSELVRLRIDDLVGSDLAGIRVRSSRDANAVVQAVKPVLRERLREYLRARPAAEPSAALFARHGRWAGEGGPLTVRHVSRIVNQWSRAAGIATRVSMRTLLASRSTDTTAWSRRHGSEGRSGVVSRMPNAGVAAPAHERSETPTVSEEHDGAASRGHTYDGSDEELLTLARSDESAARCLFHRHRPLVVALLRHVFRVDEFMVDELVDQVCESFLRYLPRLGNVRAYLRAATRGIALDHARRRASRHQAVERYLRTRPTDAVSDVENRRARTHDVEAALRVLDRRLRELVIATVIEGVSYREISLRTGMPVGSIGPTIGRALRRMREELTRA
ncbi:MAG: sigma-70 family RNA polymerase sigma factor [Acidobacteriota bacterium]